MKEKRLLALLLSLAVALTLLPGAAFAAIADEIMPLSGTIQPDGALADDWEQDESTVLGTGSLCTVEDGQRHLKAGSGNGNNGGNATPPAMFLNTTMNTALSAYTDGPKSISFDVQAVKASTGENPLFGIYLNYKRENSRTMGLAIAVDNNGKHWFWQAYKTSEEPYNDLTNSGSFDADSKHHIELEWLDTDVISFTVDGQELVTDTLKTALNDVVGDLGKIDRVAFKVGNSTGDFYISNLHYTGQADITVYDVSGTVRDDSGNPLPDAVVTAGSYTATTDDQGEYKLTLPEGTYTITASKDGYEDGSISNLSVSSDMAGKDITLTRQNWIAIQPDGAVEDEWYQDVGTKVDGSVEPRVTEDGELYLTAVAANANNCDGSPPPAFFRNTQLDAAIQEAGDGERTLSFTMTPDSTGSNLCWGVALNYTSRLSNVFIGYNTIGGWFVQYYGGSGDYPSISGVPNLVKGQTYDVEITWTNTAITSFKINGVAYSLPNDGGFGGVSVVPAVGFKCGKDASASNGGITSMTLSNVHYTGQDEIKAWSVSGKVLDDKGAPIEGAEVNAGGQFAATTDSAGAYSLYLPDGAYTVTASKDGYRSQTEMIEVDQTAVQQDFGLVLLPKVTGKVTEQDGGKAIPSATVTLTGGGDVVRSTSTGPDGTYEITGVEHGRYTVTVSAGGYEDSTDEINVNADLVHNVALAVDMTGTTALTTGKMTALVDTTFPRVIRYTVDGKTMQGRSEALNTIILNGTAVAPKVASETSNDKVTYTMTVDSTNNGGTGLDVVLTARIQVGIDGGDTTLGFFIDKVEYKNNKNQYPLETIEIPNHSLVSVSSAESGAAFTGARLASNTITSGDETFTALDKQGQNGAASYFAGFVYNDSLSAGLASNSEIGGGGGGSDNYPVLATWSSGAAVTISLSSAQWYFDRKVANIGPAKQVAAVTDEGIAVVEHTEMPFVKVVISGEANGDGKVDWQDGAVAYRDTIMHKPVNSELVPEAVNLRISMNFGSQAQNSFLLTLDNAKRVALHTDGLGQLVLLKGYASEGHDSGHPDYYNIGERMGGAADMNTMMEEGKALGVQFGIHVNASEFYPEADYFSDDTLDREGGDLNYGWNWLDQGVNLNGLYDVATGARAGRFQKLYDLVGDNLSFVYVDVWGNGQSGNEGGWQTRQLTQDITQNTDGTARSWRMAHEWSFSNPYDSTLQHWVSDYTYGGYEHKGRLNSNVLRFLFNSYKDAFPPDFATFGGASNAPLLGGPAMQGFEGWQGDAEYDTSIYNTFNQMVYTKFLQHYDIMRWINAANSVAIPYSTTANNTRSSTSNWIPEMQIYLEDAEHNEKVVVTRGLDSTLDTEASFDDETVYRSRVITLNGRIILEGAPASAGEDTAFPASKATLKYLIPWYWDPSTGERVSAADEKLYHWNAKGGSSTWELPDSWQSLSNVIVYELSDQGRGAATTVAVSDGRVTLNAEAETAYVVVRGAANKGPQFTWSTGLHVQDASFNLDLSKSPWQQSGSGFAKRVENAGGISALKLEGDISVSQTLTGLTAGQPYVTYVGVDNRSDGKAAVTIKDSAGNVAAENYTMRSIARNYISAYSLHNGKGLDGSDSYFQNMYVFFTPEAGKTYTLTLSHEGAGAAYFDDVRTLETEAENFEYDEDGNLVSFTQDFEHVAQGEYPFVVARVENVADNRQHLSSLHDPYTQAGWDVKMMDDVIDGNWSLKVNGLAGRNNLVYQTIPQNFRFEPGKTYTVSFDYELGSTGSYKVVIGDGEFTGSYKSEVALTQTLDKSRIDKEASTTAKAPVGHAEFTIVGSVSGQTWFGIYSDKAANNQGTAGNAANFGGYGDFVLDNLVITVGDVDKTELIELYGQAEDMEQDDYTAKNGDDTAAWNAFTAARTGAETVLNKADATQDEVDAAYDTLKAAMDALVKIEVVISGIVTGVNNSPVSGAEITLEDAAYMPVGLTAVTDAEGGFEFRSTGEVSLRVANYQVKVQATGYNVDTKPVTGITKASPTGSVTVALASEAPGAYVNDFNTGDLSMMGALVEDNGELPTIEAVNYNGSGAMRVTFNATTGETRHTNNVVDKTIQLANGSVSFDVTALTTGVRFGVTLRATAGNDRVCIGQQDSVSAWMGEYWKSDGTNYWSANTDANIYVAPGATRNVRVVMDGTQYTVYIDGIEVYGLAMAASQTTAGYVGINMRNNAGSQFIIDNLRIIPDDAPEAGTYTVAGTVTADGKALAGAAVAVYDAEGDLVTSTTTNASGQYKTLPVDPGEYTVKVTAPYYREKSETVHIEDANITGKDFTLTVDKTELEKLYETAGGFISNASNFTSESIAALQTAMQAARDVLDDPNATAAEIGAAYNDLYDAVYNMESRTADRSKLREALAEAKSRLEENGCQGVEALEEAVRAGEEALYSPTATQTQVDAAVRTIEAAIAGVRGHNWGEPVWTWTESGNGFTATAARTCRNGETHTEIKTATVTEDTTRRVEPTATRAGSATYMAAVTFDDGATASATRTVELPATGGSPPAVTPPTGGGSTGGRPSGNNNTHPVETPPEGQQSGNGSVNADVSAARPGDNVTVKTEPDAGYITGGIIVRDADGNAIPATKNDDGTYSFDMPDSGVTVEASFVTPGAIYKDLNDDAWYRDAVAYAINKGLMNGTGNDTFAPSTNTSRGMIATILYRLENEPEASLSDFTDVASDKYYSEAVAWAVDNGVVTGYGNGAFGPDDAITREQLVVMLWRYAGEPTASGSLAGWPDAGKVSDWAEAAMAWAVENGLINGSDGNLLPGGKAIRVQAAAILMRFCEKFGK